MYSDTLEADTGYIKFDKESRIITVTLPDLLPGKAYDLDAEDEGTIVLTNPPRPGSYTWLAEQTTVINPKFTPVGGYQTVTIKGKE